MSPLLLIANVTINRPFFNCSGSLPAYVQFSTPVYKIQRNLKNPHQHHQGCGLAEKKTVIVLVTSVNSTGKQVFHKPSTG